MSKDKYRPALHDGEIIARGSAGLSSLAGAAPVNIGIDEADDPPVTQTLDEDDLDDTDTGTEDTQDDATAGEVLVGDYVVNEIEIDAQEVIFDSSGGINVNVDVSWPAISGIKRYYVRVSEA